MNGDRKQAVVEKSENDSFVLLFEEMIRISNVCEYVNDLLPKIIKVYDICGGILGAQNETNECMNGWMIVVQTKEEIFMNIINKMNNSEQDIAWKSTNSTNLYLIPVICSMFSV